jgi:hypothetical protein
MPISDPKKVNRSKSAVHCHVVLRGVNQFTLRLERTTTWAQKKQNAIMTKEQTAAE